MNIPITTPGTLARARTPVATIARRMAVTAALALTVFGISGSTASASSDERIDVKYGYAAFRADGDELAAGDIHGDGIGVRARLAWQGRDGRTKSAKVTDGFAGVESSKHLSIREGTTVYLRLCYTNNGADIKCSQIQRGEA